MTKAAFVIGTCDTKFAELDYVRKCLINAGLPTILVDVSTLDHESEADISAREVVAYASRKLDEQSRKNRGAAIEHMSQALENFLSQRSDVGGVIGLGGSGGTALITRALRALPIGVPKIMVSTVAAGNVAPYVDVSDLIMINSVTDIAGINQISHTILGNAAHALSGMMKESLPVFVVDKPLVGMTMFGVTTPGVMKIRDRLADQYETVIFHATGTGGRAMEKMIESDLIPFVIDITTTEICDLHMGGIMSAGEQRMDIILRRKIPYLISLGALDMVNFGAMDTVPNRYKTRLLHRHNPQVTLMRTTPEENKQMGKWIAKKINGSSAPVRLFIPLKGISALSVFGQPFHDPEADRALFESLRQNIHQTEDRRMIELNCDINSTQFAESVEREFRALCGPV